MRTLHTAADQSAIEPSRIVAWTRNVAMMFAAAALVLGASLVAVAMSLD